MVSGCQKAWDIAEMVQSEKYENLGVDPPNPCKNQAWQHISGTLELGRQRSEVYEACWPSRLPESAGSRLNEGLSHRQQTESGAEDA